jgi:hypothetical protein
MRYEIIIKPWNQNKLGTRIIMNQILKVKSRKKKDPKKYDLSKPISVVRKKKKKKSLGDDNIFKEVKIILDLGH